eukprot:gene18033-21477_t
MSAPKEDPLDTAKVDELFTKATESEDADARVAAAGELVTLVLGSGAKYIDSLLLSKVKTAMTNKKKVPAREGAANIVKAIVEGLTPESEAFVLSIVTELVLMQGDKASSVRDIATAACDVYSQKVSPYAVRALLPALFSGLESSFWQAKAGALNMLITLTTRAPKQVAANLPEIIPKVSEVMTDMKAEVVTAAQTCMAKACDTIGNLDIEPFIPTLIECITKIDEVPECVHKLAATTFVQQVEAPTLAVMGPLLQRGLARQQATAIKRKACVIIDNMCKLVEDPTDAEPFLPKLLPGVKHALDEVADPECRQVANRAFKTLVHAAGEEAAKALDSGKAEVNVLNKLQAEVKDQLSGVLSETSACSKEDITKFWAESGADVLVDYVCSLCTNAIAGKCFDTSEWSEKCVVPYLSSIMAKDSAEKACTSLVSTALAAFEAKKKTYAPDDEEGEDTCNCEFSLAYGAMILLNNATLRLKRGKRYGLCGPNGCGKSTLMKAINNGQVEGFPPRDEVRTVYVEHDIQGHQGEMSVLEFVLDEPILKEMGTTREDVLKELTHFQFTMEMIEGPITALSGGWKMKLALGRAMLQKADILLLDEPTNHMDVKNVAWLETYLNNLETVTSMIVSHDSGFLDNVCTHIIHYETRKLVTYRGNLQEFVEQCPAAKKYYELSNDELKFIFPPPGFLEGVKNKDKAIVKANNVTYGYPGTGKKIIEKPCSVQISLSSRVGCLGPNGAGKSTLIKMLTGESEPDTGNIWKHQNMRYAYVAQHAFHHLEQHLDKSPNEYIRWRYSGGEDKENLTKVTAQYTPEEEKQMAEKIKVTGMEWQEEGKIEMLVLDKIIGRRSKKNTQEYEVVWKDKSMDNTTYIEREKLEKLGFTKYLNRIDEREAARAGLYARPLTIKNVEKHIEDFGLDAEFGTHNRIRGLSGGQKVKVVLAAAMWNLPHVLVLDEPTNYLDRDALGALALGIKDYGGGVVIITHNAEFAAATCEETWTVGGGFVEITGQKWNSSSKSEAVEFVQEEETVDALEEETVDALGNVIKCKGPKRKLSRKEIKARQKARKSKLEAGEDLSTDSDWELDEYIGDEAEKAAKEAEKKEKEAAKAAEKAAKEAEKAAKGPAKGKGKAKK